MPLDKDSLLTTRHQQRCVSHKSEPIDARRVPVECLDDERSGAFRVGHIVNFASFVASSHRETIIAYSKRAEPAVTSHLNKTLLCIEGSQIFQVNDLPLSKGKSVGCSTERNVRHCEVLLWFVELAQEGLRLCRVYSEQSNLVLVSNDVLLAHSTEFDSVTIELTKLVQAKSFHGRTAPLRHDASLAHSDEHVLFLAVFAKSHLDNSAAVNID